MLAMVVIRENFIADVAERIMDNYRRAHACVFLRALGSKKLVLGKPISCDTPTEYATQFILLDDSKVMLVRKLLARNKAIMTYVTGPHKIGAGSPIKVAPPYYLLDVLRDNNNQIFLQWKKIKTERALAPLMYKLQNSKLMRISSKYFAEDAIVEAMEILNLK